MHSLADPWGREGVLDECKTACPLIYPLIIEELGNPGDDEDLISRSTGTDQPSRMFSGWCFLSFRLCLRWLVHCSYGLYEVPVADGRERVTCALLGGHCK